MRGATRDDFEQRPWGPQLFRRTTLARVLIEKARVLNKSRWLMFNTILSSTERTRYDELMQERAFKMDAFIPSSRNDKNFTYGYLKFKMGNSMRTDSSSSWAYGRATRIELNKFTFSLEASKYSKLNGKRNRFLHTELIRRSALDSWFKAR